MELLKLYFLSGVMSENWIKKFVIENNDVASKAVKKIDISVLKYFKVKRVS